nr:hypothetical protein BaRGS_026793 [Batillaria attramentaria]KAG5695669.1 hypothetical protein BaRGS_029159 [Batillaria attramentaria]
MTPVQESVLGLPQASWSERATIALNVLRLLQRLDARLPEPLIMCDIKGDNFGLTESGEARLLDTDEVIFNSSMSSTKGRTNACTRDHDCVYNHCDGFCDTQRGTCHMDSNYNLQVSRCNIHF